MRGGNNTHVPAGAKLEERASVDLPSGIHVRVERYSGQASDGYQTNYQQRPAAWVAWIRRDGGTLTYREVKRYSGRNLDRARSDFAEAAAVVRAAGLAASTAEEER